MRLYLSLGETLGLKVLKGGLLPVYWGGRHHIYEWIMNYTTTCY